MYNPLIIVCTPEWRLIGRIPFFRCPPLRWSDMCLRGKSEGQIVVSLKVSHQHRAWFWERFDRISKHQGSVSSWSTLHQLWSNPYLIWHFVCFFVLFARVLPYQYVNSYTWVWIDCHDGCLFSTSAKNAKYMVSIIVNKYV